MDGDLPNQGRVEVRYYGVWGSVAIDKWSKRNKAHHVICRMLGFNRGLTFGRARTNGSGPFLVSNLHCNGNEASIEQCSRTSWGKVSAEGTDELEVHCEKGKPGFGVN